MGRGQTKTTEFIPAAADGFYPIMPVVELVFSRWAQPVLWGLEEYGPMRFGEIEALLAPVTAKVLTLRLRQLERDGLIVRTDHHETPPRVDYEISGLGRALLPVFAVVGDWSREHLSQVEAARRNYDSVPSLSRSSPSGSWARPPNA